MFSEVALGRFLRTLLENDNKRTENVQVNVVIPRECFNARDPDGITPLNLLPVVLVT